MGGPTLDYEHHERDTMTALQPMLAPARVDRLGGKFVVSRGFAWTMLVLAVGTIAFVLSYQP